MVTLLMTTTLLAAGGLGIYLWKSNDDGDSDNEEPLVEDNNANEDEDYDNDDYDDKPVQKKAAKTRRSRKRHTGTKRRYNY